MSGNNAQNPISPISDPQTVVVDLDRYLTLQPGQAPAVAGSVVTSGLAVKVVAPETDRIAIVGIQVDDSGSIAEARLEQAVIEGLELSIKAFRGAKGSDFFLDVRGFQQVYFSGMLKDMERNPCKYYKGCGGTPLIETALEQLTLLMKKAAEYRATGINAMVAQLIMTDGLPNGAAAPETFAARVSDVNYVVGMGFVGVGGAAAFTDLFRRMGITKVVTPNVSAADIRHAINQFSQSVASIATK